MTLRPSQQTRHTMPYEHIEQIGDRSDERFALGLGASQMMGILAMCVPILLISGQWPLGLRAGAIIGSALIGFLATVEIQGLPAYQWPIWWGRGRIQRALHGDRITPDDLPGMAQPTVRAPLRVGGPLRPARRASVRQQAVIHTRPDSHVPTPPSLPSLPTSPSPPIMPSTSSATE